VHEILYIALSTSTISTTTTTTAITTTDMTTTATTTADYNYDNQQLLIPVLLRGSFDK